MTTLNKRPDGVVCLLDSERGVYIPQNFAESYDLLSWGIPQEDIDILLYGTEHDEYWDAWADVLDTAEYSVEYKGKEYTYKLWQDGDLWAYCPELMTREEWESFGFYAIDYPCPEGWFELEVCDDCLLYLSNGDLPPDSSPDRDQEIIDGVGNLHHPSADGTPLGFSYTSCDCCRSPLGGDRYRVYEKEREA